MRKMRAFLSTEVGWGQKMPPQAQSSLQKKKCKEIRDKEHNAFSMDIY